MIGRPGSVRGATFLSTYTTSRASLRGAVEVVAVLLCDIVREVRIVYDSDQSEERIFAGFEGFAVSEVLAQCGSYVRRLRFAGAGRDGLQSALEFFVDVDLLANHDV